VNRFNVTERERDMVELQRAAESYTPLAARLVAQRPGVHGGPLFRGLLFVVAIYVAGYGAWELIRRNYPRLALVVATGAGILILGVAVVAVVLLTGDGIRAWRRR
jgi:hypothetical protein